jgi:hypothetical protein
MVVFLQSDGRQLPWDRLLAAVDELIPGRKPS